MKHTSISVIIPCYNESSIIYKTIETVADFLYSQGFLFEIIPVDDGSTDDTIKEIRRAQKNLPNINIHPVHNKTNHGKGYAVKNGVEKSVHEVIVFIDADLTVSIKELSKFLEELENHDIVIASRSLNKTRFEEHNPWYRKILASGFQTLNNIILGKTRIKDTQCGFKVFRKSPAKEIFSKITINRFAFDAEALFIARMYKYSIKQLPVTIHKDTRKSHVNAILDPINMAISLIKIRINEHKGLYKKN